MSCHEVLKPEYHLNKAMSGHVREGIRSNNRYKRYRPCKRKFNIRTAILVLTARHWYNETPRRYATSLTYLLNGSNVIPGAEQTRYFYRVTDRRPLGDVSSRAWCSVDEGTCCLHVQGRRATATAETEEAGSYGTLVPLY
jgi:hypothetical protein